MRFFYGSVSLFLPAAMTLTLVAAAADDSSSKSKSSKPASQEHGQKYVRPTPLFT